MISLLVVPSSSVVSVFLMPWMPAIVIGTLTVSAILSGWLRQRPRMQTVVTAVAMATILAAAIYSAAHPKAFPATVKALTVDCSEWWNWLQCWL
jgi:CHASE2 domain-containing sensor protein